MLDYKLVDDQVPNNKERYQRLVGKLIYLSYTCPNITCAISINPSKRYVEVVIRILCYLKSAPGRGIIFLRNNHLNIIAYWVGSIFDRKSTSGHFTYVGGNLVTWRRKKQKVVTQSNAEVRRLLTEIGFESKTKMNLFCDHNAAIEITHTHIQHDHTKHIEINKHFIKQNLEEKIIKFPFVQFEDQLVDMLTKLNGGWCLVHALLNFNSTFSYIHTKIRNILKYNELQNLIFTHCNMKLKMRHGMRKSQVEIKASFNPINLDYIF
ncbi:hypothetical protein CR513_41482, partial [Mucuna pruriens]